MPEDFRFDFNPLWQLSETEQATVEKTRAERDQVYLNAGVVTEALVARELKERGTYRNMTDDDIELAEELSKRMDENGEVGKAPGAKPPEGGEGGDDDEQVAGVAQGGKAAPATSGGE
jgi:hypothetical protein